MLVPARNHGVYRLTFKDDNVELWHDCCLTKGVSGIRVSWKLFTSCRGCESEMFKMWGWLEGFLKCRRCSDIAPIPARTD